VEQAGMKNAERLVEISRRLARHEVLPGLILPAPRFEPRGNPRVDVDGHALPPSFLEFVETTGAIYDSQESHQSSARRGSCRSLD
jgi:hypothetical protein